MLGIMHLYEVKKWAPYVFQAGKQDASSNHSFFLEQEPLKVQYR